MVSWWSNLALLVAALAAPDLVLTEESVAQQLKQRGASRQVAEEMLAAFYDAVLAEERYEALGQQRQTLAGLVSMNEKRFGEGVIAERDLIRTRIESSRVDLQLSQARLTLDDALIRLKALLDLEEDARAIQIDHRFDESPALLSRESLRGGGLPEVASAAAAYEAAREKIQTIKLRLLQQAEESYSIERLLYDQLKTDLLTVLEALRTRTEVRLAYSAALHQVARSRLRLGYLSGRAGEDRLR